VADAGHGIKANSGAWTFHSQGVADGFDQHVALSVPAYDDVQRLVCGLASYYVRPGSSVVDLGCATGRTLADLALSLPERAFKAVGVDEASPMLAKARERQLAASSWVCADASSFSFPRDTSLVIALYAFQFMALDDRWALLRRLGRELPVGAGLIVVEKTLCESHFATMIDHLYLERKVAAGFHPEQVLAKAASLRGTMRPAPARDTERVLRESGFVVERFWQSLAFVGWVCERGRQ
jgi:tRNA (cmo5U34)-methyltransferase